MIAADDERWAQLPAGSERTFVNGRRVGFRLALRVMEEAGHVE